MQPASWLTVVWMGSSMPTLEHARALQQWADEHSIEMSAPKKEQSGTGANPGASVEALERKLESAREDLASHDEQRAARKLRAIEQELREHPELPQSAWLMSETLFLLERAAGALKESSLVGPLSAARRALEPVRATAFGEEELPTVTTQVPTSHDRQASLATKARVLVRGAREHQIFWDGSLTPDETALAPGEHHLRITRDGLPVWASWLTPPIDGTLEIWVPDALPCSEEDLRDAEGDASSVTCSSWARVRPIAQWGTAIEITRCAGSRCGPAFAYPSSWSRKQATAQTAKARPSPWWWLGGAGALVTTGIVLWAAGAFRSPRVETTTVYDGHDLR